MSFQTNAIESPLILAVKNQSERSVRMLLKCNFAINQVDQYGETALQKIHYELIKDSSIPGAILMKLVDKCETEEEAALKLLDAKCPLHIAVLLKNRNIIKFFLDRGINNINNKHAPALHVAVIHEYFEGVKLLIEYGFDVNSIDPFYSKPLYCVREVNDKEEHLAILKLLLDRGAELTTVMQFHRRMQIFSVFQSCTKEAIQLVLQAGIDFCAKDGFGATPLHYLANNKNPGILELLKDQMLDIEAKDICGLTALHNAAMCGHINNCEYLLNLGANVNAKNNSGDTILFSVLRRFPESSENFKCVEVLLKYDAEIQVLNTFTKETVFHVVVFCRNSKLIQPVLAHLALLEDSGTMIIDEIRNKIESTSEFKNPFELYKQQLEQLKKTTIFESVNMFQLLTIEEKKLLVYLRNQQLVSNAKLFICQNNRNTYYYRKFKERIEHGLQKVQLRRRAAEVLCEIMHFYYDSYPAVIDKIFNYLDESEILKIEKLGKIKVIR